MTKNMYTFINKLPLRLPTITQKSHLGKHELQWRQTQEKASCTRVNNGTAVSGRPNQTGLAQANSRSYCILNYVLK